MSLNRLCFNWGLSFVEIRKLVIMLFSKVFTYLIIITILFKIQDVVRMFRQRCDLCRIFEFKISSALLNTLHFGEQVHVKHFEVRAFYFFRMDYNAVVAVAARYVYLGKSPFRVSRETLGKTTNL